MPEFVCIGVPHFLGEKLETRTEVAQIKASGFVDQIRAKWVEIKPDYSNYDDPIIAVNAALAESIAQNSDRFPIVFAADCVSSIGMVKGLGHNDLNVLWYDAHGDFNTPETSPSGFLGGMPLAALVGRGNQHWLVALDLKPLLEENIIITDVRHLDPVEGVKLFGSNIEVIEDVDELLDFPLPDEPTYIHLDVDILDPKYMPALGYPAENGPNTEAVIVTLKYAAQRGNIVGLLVSLWNGDKAEDDGPMNTTLEMVQALIENL
jgi:arginase